MFQRAGYLQLAHCSGRQTVALFFVITSYSIHYTKLYDLQRAVSRVRELGKKAGVALNPSTSLSAIEWVLTDIDLVLLMTVNPGFGGQAYLPSMTGKIELLRSQLDRTGLSVDIEVDGGIKEDNRITSYNVCYTKLLRKTGQWATGCLPGAAYFQQP